VSDLYIPTIDLPILLEEICRPIQGLYKSLIDMHMNVEIRAEAALFLEKEYIKGIFVAVCFSKAFEISDGFSQDFF
jgi:hypothetical protein